MLFNANFSAISYPAQVNFQWDDDEGPLCTRPTRLVGFLYCYLTETTGAGRHVDPHRHIILIPSQPDFTLSP
jgi:hypothetical protein